MSERGPAILHTPSFARDQREAVAMTTRWQLLSLCVPRALAVSSIQRLGVTDRRGGAAEENKAKVSLPQNLRFAGW